jgi:hypothetical protein
VAGRIRESLRPFLRLIPAFRPVPGRPPRPDAPPPGETVSHRDDTTELDLREEVSPVGAGR